MGHVGLTPQSIRLRWVQGAGQDHRPARAIVDDGAILAPRPGASPSCSSDARRAVARLVTDSIPVPTIGIGAGRHCDGQVLVYHDLLGMQDWLRPKFVRRYAEFHTEAVAAVVSWATCARAPSRRARRPTVAATTSPTHCAARAWGTQRPSRRDRALPPRPRSRRRIGWAWVGVGIGVRRRGRLVRGHVGRARRRLRQGPRDSHGRSLTACAAKPAAARCSGLTEPGSAWGTSACAWSSPTSRPSAARGCGAVAQHALRRDALRLRRAVRLRVHDVGVPVPLDIGFYGDGEPVSRRRMEPCPPATRSTAQRTAVLRRTCARSRRRPAPWTPAHSACPS